MRKNLGFFNWTVWLLGFLGVKGSVKNKVRNGISMFFFSHSDNYIKNN